LAKAPRPDVIFIALTGASNLADFEFASSGATSPAKFVFTLPNICASVIFQMLGHHGKVYCLHHGADTLEFAQNEARFAAKTGRTAWVFSSSAELHEGRRQVRFELFPPSR